MHGYQPRTYGDSFADVYDEWYGDVSDVDGTVDTILHLAGGRPILELGVGTGRLAIPLAERGAQILGVDASLAMLQQLEAKPGGASVAAVLSDMAELGVDRSRFGVAFAAFNTFFNLTDDESQRRCGAEVRRALRDDGRFVVEAFVPPAGGMPPSGLTMEDRGRALVVTASVHDAETRQIRGHHVELDRRGARLRPWALHYRTPRQLDELLADVGFVLEARWADWHGSSFTEDAESHVSIYRPAGGDLA